LPNSQFGDWAAMKYIASNCPPIPHENYQQLENKSGRSVDADEPAVSGLMLDATGLSAPTSRRACSSACATTCAIPREIDGIGPGVISG
jgi:hypothetical protein